MKELNDIDYKQLKKLFPARAPNAHKGDFGHVLVIGGDYGYPGAPLLSTLGALRVGAGLVTLASHQFNLTGINAVHPEIMTSAIDKPQDLQPLLAKASVIVLGPGLGRSAWSQDIFLNAINTQLPLVLDADGLYWLAQIPQQRNNWVLTPHPGEAATLLHKNQAIPETERLATIETLIKTHNATVVLKGQNTLVGSPGKPIEICNAGNPGMASGGMGDLLSGLIAGLIAQKLDLDSATKLAVCVHAMAGNLIASQQGQRGMLATDLLPAIRKLIN